MKKTFEQICEICRMARELAKQYTLRLAAMFLKNEGVPLEYALSCLVYKPL